jgi:hypothetical protein
VPTVSRLVDSFQVARSALLDFIWGRTDAAATKLAAANRVHPDALVLFLQAIAQATSSVQRLKKDRAASVRLATQARNVAYLAADAPTIVPRTSYRYQARLTGLMIDSALNQEPSAADPLRPARMREQCDRAAAEGKSLPKARRKYLPQGLEKGHDLDCARFLVAAWLRDEPDAWTLVASARVSTCALPTGCPPRGVLNGFYVHSPPTRQ